MTVTTALPPPRRAHLRRPDAATQWQLVWRRFRKHRLALAGVAIIAMLVVSSLFAEILAPYGPSERNPRYINGPPMLVRVMDADGFHLRPFVFGRKMSRDPVTLRPEPIVDETSQWPIQFFVRGQEYSFWACSAAISICLARRMGSSICSAPTISAAMSSPAISTRLACRYRLA